MKVFLEKKIDCNVDVMKSVVMDVVHYPEFINLCRKVVAFEGINGNKYYDIDVGYGIISSKVICKVSHSGNDIFFSGESKILSKMNGKWSISGDKAHTNAYFELDISFKNPILDKLFESKKEMLSSYIVNLFISRAMQCEKDFVKD
jgi:ribosome-associated toxin RatA of RatAB toxin-antitoxin module